MVSLEKNDHLMLARQLPLKSVALILAGGRGTRLKDLTNKRAKPAVHFGGKFRIIDFALSNCINSGIRRMGVITQYQSHTLVQSVLFSRVRVNSFCNIDSAVLLPEVWVGRSCRLRRCVIDRACVIPEGMVIGENAEEDARRFYRSEEGIVLVTREMLRKLGHKQER